MKTAVHLGYESGTGKPVEIPIRHMAVTGQTQESGKTTTLEGLIYRAELPAIAFLTKRGEASLTGRPILPFFRERADWPWVESILESIMREKKKWERAWIVKACRGARTLAEVESNVHKLQESARRGLDQDMYMLLGEYLRRVVPLLASLPKTDSLDLIKSDHLCVMDLIPYPVELQMLVIASTLDWIHKYAEGVITVIPEAWKFIPEGKNTPVKVVAESLAREGAGLKNYLWIDSQDIAGVWKTLLRGCAVWLLGVQREANEVKRTIENMPAAMKRPKPADVASLELGHFFCSHGRELTQVYVQPAWMDSDTAKRIADGRISLFHAPISIREMKEKYQRENAPAEEDKVWKQRFEAEQLRASGLETQLTAVQAELQALREEIRSAEVAGKKLRLREPSPAPDSPAPAVSVLPRQPAGAGDNGRGSAEPAELEPLVREDRIVARVLAAIREDPVLIRLAAERPAIEVTIQKKVLTLDEGKSGVKGKVARLMSEGFFSEPRTFTSVRKELERRGLDPKTANVRISEPLKELTDCGFFLRGLDKSYQLAPDAVVTTVNA